MRTSLLFCPLVLYCILQCATIIRANGLDPDDPNVCEKVEQYPYEKQIKTTIPYTKRTYKWCRKFPFRCPHEETHYRESYRLETKMETRTIFVCCEGYHQSANNCIPVCVNQCIHGKCVKPETCECEPGYGGSTCNIFCPEGSWGSKCEQKCNCANNSRCNPVDGRCSCLPGTWGPDCSNVCTCQNGVCDSITGACSCTPGFVGTKCDRSCPEGTFGPQCLSRCSCQTNQTEACQHTNGFCICRPGFNGLHCENLCPSNSFGRNCEQKCNCPSNGYVCDPFVGCVCKQPHPNEVDSCAEVIISQSFRSDVETAPSRHNPPYGTWIFILLIITSGCLFLLNRYKRKVKQLKMELHSVIYMRGGNSNDQFDNPLYAGNEGLRAEKLPSQIISSAHLPLAGYPNYCKNNIEKAKMLNTATGGPSSINYLDGAAGLNKHQQNQKSFDVKISEFNAIDNEHEAINTERANPNIYTSIDEIKSVFINKEPVYDEIATKQDLDDYKPMGTMIRESKTIYDSDNSINESMSRAMKSESIKVIDHGKNIVAQVNQAPLHYDMPRSSPRLIENPMDPFSHYETLSTASTFQADQKDTVGPNNQA